MINEYTDFIDDMKESLYSAYVCKDWGMEWPDFLLQAQSEIDKAMDIMKDCLP